MPKIHMDTERVRGLATKLDSESSRIDDFANIIKREKNHLSMAWMSSGNSQDYLQELNAWANNCAGKAQELLTLALRVSREVDEWESVDLSRNIHTALPVKGGTGLLVGSGVMLTVADSSDLTPIYGLDVTAKGNSLKWSSKDGNESDDIDLGIGVGVGVGAALWGQETKISSEAVSIASDVKAVNAEIGANVGLDKNGLSAGVHGELNAFKASTTAVVGSALFGFTGGATVKAGTVEGSLGLNANTKDVGVEAKVGASLVSGEVDAGMNIAGVNLGISAGVSVGMEFGVKLGPEVEVAIGPFQLGFHIGSAIT